jgi:hypothetical protein
MVNLLNSIVYLMERNEKFEVWASTIATFYVCCDSNEFEKLCKVPVHDVEKASMETIPVYVEALPEREVVLHAKGAETEDEVSFKRSRGSHMEIDHVAPVNVSRDIVVGRKILAWAHQTLQEAERHAYPHGTFRESKRL